MKCQILHETKNRMRVHFYDNISSNSLMYALCDNDRLKSKNTEKQL